jgi:hypothetical protein
MRDFASLAGNRELFDGVLVGVFITYQRSARFGGHLHIDRHSRVERHRQDVEQALSDIDDAQCQSYGAKPGEPA